jgi:hypothetical protein
MEGRCRRHLAPNRGRSFPPVDYGSERPFPTPLENTPFGCVIRLAHVLLLDTGRRGMVPRQSWKERRS